MRVIGITGGIGSGKSTVMNLLKQNFNCCVIIADDVAKETMKKGNTGYHKVLEIFGEDILARDEEIDRKVLSQIVFHNKNKLMVLNSIIHPLVKKIIIEKINSLKCEGVYEYIFIEAALLIEDHYNIICDELWYIYADENVRAARLRQSRGYSEEKILEVMNNQLSENEYKKHCSQIIFNDKNVEDTLSQLKKLLEG